MTRRRDLEPFSDALNEFTRAVQPSSAIAEIQRVWPSAAGEMLSGWAQPVSEIGGTVTFKCTDSMVAHELEMMKLELLKKLAEALPDNPPKELKFRTR
jgi:predicted nucleic acid-binding Zn ribbon protein